MQLFITFLTSYIIEVIFMINLLVVESNVEQCKNIVNYISRYSNQVKVCGIAYNDEDAIEIINTKLPDLIFLDLNLPNLEAFNILNYITEKKLNKYVNAIIMIANKPISKSKFEHSQYINCFFKKPVELRNVVLRLNEIAAFKLSNSDEALIRNKITHELEILNYNFSYHGSKYMVDALYELYINKDKYYDNLSKDVYPVLAKKHHKKANTIKCDICHATKMMFYDCNEQVIANYFKLSSSMKPTVKQFIFTILNKL